MFRDGGLSANVSAKASISPGLRLVADTHRGPRAKSRTPRDASGFLRCGGSSAITAPKTVELDDARHATHRLIGARRYPLLERRLGPPPPRLDTRRLAWPCEAELRRWAGWRSRFWL